MGKNLDGGMTYLIEIQIKCCCTAKDACLMNMSRKKIVIVQMIELNYCVADPWCVRLGRQQPHAPGVLELPYSASFSSM